jgi:hypothetical protein
MPRPFIALLLACAFAIPAAAPVAAKAPAPPHLAPPQALFREAITLRQFVKGTLRFVILHETGHGLVDLYDLPVLGREEDAADRFATFWLSPDEAGEDGTDAAAAMEWWLAAGRMNGRKREELPWWDEHGIDEQRGYQIACLLYGAAPDDYLPLAKRVGIPETRLRGCRLEALQNAGSWSGLLRDRVSKLSNLDGFFTPLTYMPASKDTADAAQIAKEMGILEEVRDVLHQFRYTDKTKTVKLIGRDCGTSNAFWNPDDDELTLCYELVNEIAEVGYAAGFR